VKTECAFYAGVGAVAALLFLIVFVALPYFVPARVSIPNSACRVNLRSIQAAKEMWANEHKKGPADVPQFSDLIGPDKYLRAKPVCPLDGTYRLGVVREKPTCSFGASNPGHTFEFNR
jgi:hypothetical protein